MSVFKVWLGWWIGLCWKTRGLGCRSWAILRGSVQSMVQWVNEVNHLGTVFLEEVLSSLDLSEVKYRASVVLSDSDTSTRAPQANKHALSQKTIRPTCTLRRSVNIRILYVHSRLRVRRCTVLCTRCYSNPTLSGCWAIRVYDTWVPVARVLCNTYRSWNIIKIFTSVCHCSLASFLATFCQVQCWLVDPPN